MLKVGGLDPARDHSLVRQPERVLQLEQPRDQPRRDRRPSGREREEPGPFALKELPVDQPRQRDQLVTHVDHVDEARPEEVVLLGRTGTMLPAADRNCRVPGRVL